MSNQLSLLQRLEAESIHILREVMACAQSPVLLYSMGKDSSVLLHVARKAFFPAPIPFPVLHIDTGWKFREMIAFRDRVAVQYQLNLICHTNIHGQREGITPFGPDVARYTTVMKTEALKQALGHYGFNVCIGGARRDEEKSRAKERIFSYRDPQHRWNPKQQRPEVWNIYNLNLNPGESLRVFPLSNWTELDIWRYIAAENIQVVPLYFAKHRPVVWRQGAWVMVDDERLPLSVDERVQPLEVRFRTLGCYPLTGAVESKATSVAQIIEELEATRWSERQGRLIDYTPGDSMEAKKRFGYF